MQLLAKELATVPSSAITIICVAGITILIAWACVIWADIKLKVKLHEIGQFVAAILSLIATIFIVFVIAKQRSIVNEPMQHYTITKIGDKLHMESHTPYLKTADVTITRTGDDYYLVQYKDVEAVIWRKDLGNDVKK